MNNSFNKIRLVITLREPDWELPVDLEEPQFKRIQEDEDQMRAARYVGCSRLILVNARIQVDESC